jgi:hypothetical protein
MELGRSIFVLLFATYGFGRFVMLYFRALAEQAARAVQAKVPFR